MLQTRLFRIPDGLIGNSLSQLLVGCERPEVPPALPRVVCAYMLGTQGGFSSGGVRNIRIIAGNRAVRATLLEEDMA